MQPRKTLVLVTVLLVSSLYLAACGGTTSGELPTSAPEATVAQQPTAAAEPTSPPVEVPTEEPPTEELAIPTDEPVVPTETPIPPTEEPAEPTPTLVPLEPNTFPQGDVFGDELQFQTFVSDPTIGSDDGAGIESVTFRILDGNGQVVHERTERNALYCAFGGGDDLQNCDVWRFSEHNNQWPSGVPVENGGVYVLQSTTKAKSGQTATQELTFTIQL